MADLHFVWFVALASLHIHRTWIILSWGINCSNQIIVTHYSDNHASFTNNLCCLHFLCYSDIYPSYSVLVLYQMIHLIKAICFSVYSGEQFSYSCFYRWFDHADLAESLVACPCCLPAPTQMLEPVTLPGIVSCVLSVLCSGLNLLRGVHAIESVLQVRKSLSSFPLHLLAGIYLAALCQQWKVKFFWTVEAMSYSFI